MPMPQQFNMDPLLSMMNSVGDVGGGMSPIMSLLGGMRSGMGGAMGAGAGGMDWETLMRMLSGGGGNMGGNPFARTSANSGGAFTMPGTGAAPLQSIVAAQQPMSPMSGYINRLMQYR